MDLTLSTNISHTFRIYSLEAQLRLLLTSVLLGCLLACFVSIPALGQDSPATEIGAVPNRSFDLSAIDAVDTENGNVIVHIPLVDFPQRGRIRLGFSLVSNSANPTWSVVSDDMDVSRSYAGPDVVLDGGFDAYKEVFMQNPLQPSPPALTFQNNFVVIDSTGANHPLGYDYNNLSQLHSTDGSDYLLLPANPQDYMAVQIPYLAPESGVLYSKDGIAHSSSMNNNVLTDTYADLDGNLFTRTITNPDDPYQNGWSGQYADSLGRTFADPATALANIIVNPTSASSFPAPSAQCPTINALYQPLLTSYSWSVPGPNGSPQSYLFCLATVTITSINDLGGDNPTVYSYQPITVLQSVVLPDNTYWEFIYDSANLSTDPTTSPIAYGDLVKIVTPKGGSISYTFSNYQTICLFDGQSTRPLSSRTFNDGNGHVFRWNYTYTALLDNNNISHFGATVTDPYGNQTVHNYQELRSGSCLLEETDSSVYAQSGTQLQKQAFTYSFMDNPQDTDFVKENPEGATVPFSWDAPFSISGSAAAYYTGIFKTSTTTTVDGRLVSQETYQYDNGFYDAQPECTQSIENGALVGTPSCTFGDGPSPLYVPLGLIVSTTKYGYGVGAPGALLSTSNTTYAYTQTQNSTFNNLDLIGLPGISTVYDSSGTLAKSTSYTYDANGHLLKTTSQVDQNDSVSESESWNSSGMLQSRADANGNTTQYGYDSTGAFANSIQQPSTNGTVHVDTYTYDPNTGLKTSHTDDNGVVTDYIYDNAARLLQARKAIGTPIESWTSYSYPTSNQVNEAQDQVHTQDGAIKSSIVIDGFGRTIQTISADGSTAETTYDAFGKKASVTNRHTATPSSSDGMTSFVYDALGRMTTQMNPDGSVRQRCFNGIATTSQTNCTSPTGNLSWVDDSDELGNHWKMGSDVSGNLIEVLEPNASNVPTMETDYGFNVRNDLISVTQFGGPSGSSGAEGRNSYYDDLSRLTKAINPESGVSQYSYDGNENLLTETDARGLVKTNTYDALNRITRKTYSDKTPSSCYQYDNTAGGSYGIGRLWFEWTQIGSCPMTPLNAPPSGNYLSLRVYGAYDAMGRVVSEQQCTAGYCSSAAIPSPPPANCTSLTGGSGLQYCFNLTGDFLAYSNGITLSAAGGYPSMAMGLSQSFDTAGRLNTVSSSWSDPTHPSTLFTSQGYTPFGPLANWLLGSHLSVDRTYDNRLRITGQTGVQQ